MANISSELAEPASFVRIVAESDVPSAKKMVLEEYIRQLETRIGVTDPALHPRHRARLQNELNLAKIELDNVTESITSP